MLYASTVFDKARTVLNAQLKEKSGTELSSEHGDYVLAQALGKAHTVCRKRGALRYDLMRYGSKDIWTDTS
jgi:hypothetical protein